MFQISSTRKQMWLSAIGFGIVALLFGLWLYYNYSSEHTPKEINLTSGTAFPIPRQIKPFRLDNAPDGTPFTNTQFKGQWSMLFFGFTHCPYLCPTTLTILNQFYTNLVADRIAQTPQIYFVSVDPERDSLQRINQYVTSFNKNFKGATGTQSQLEALTNELNILYAKVKISKKNEDYQIDHSGTVLLINPDGNLAALFSPPLDAKALTQDYKILIEHSVKESKKQ